MILMAIILFGFISLSRLAVDLFPDLEIPIVAIITQYSGAGPKEVEKSVTRIIEGAVGGVNSIDSISSVSREGSSMVMINFKWGAPLDSLTGDIREKLDIIKDALPDEAGAPLLFKFSPSMMPIMILGLRAQSNVDMEALYEMTDEKIKTKLEQVPGMASVSVLGGLKREIHVNVIKNRLQAYGLDINGITMKLMMENQNVAGGSVYEDMYKYTVRTVGEFKSLEDIGEVILTIRNNIPVRIKDIADIRYGYDEDNGVIRINREPGLLLLLNKETGLNTVQTAKKIKKVLAELNAGMPAGMVFETIFDSSNDISRSINGVVSAAYQGVFFAVLVLLIFLWNFRTVFVIGVSIPVSIIVTFICMYALDINLNMISLSGLALGVGMMVDSSIVVLENIFHYRVGGMGKFSSASKGSNEVSLAITASTLTTIVIFVPFLIVEGLVKEIFWDLAMTVSISLLASLLVSLTVIPMLSSRLLNPESGNKGILARLEKRFSAWIEAINIRYRGIVYLILPRKKKFIAAVMLLTIVIGGLILVFIGKEGFPKNDQGQFIVSVNFPPGTRAEFTDGMVKKIEKDLMDITGKSLRVMSMQIKGGGMFAAFQGAADYKATIRVGLVPVNKRKTGVEEYIEKVRVQLREYPAKISVRNQGGMMMGGSDSALTLEIHGDDLEKSDEIAAHILQVMKTVKGIREPEIAKDDQMPEISLVINRGLASKLGLNAQNIANAVKTGFGGQAATSLKTDSGTDLQVIVRLRPEDRILLDDIMSMSLPTPLGKMVPLASIIDAEKTVSPSAINRKESRRIITLNSDVYGRPIDQVVADLKEKISSSVYIPRGFDLVYGGSFKDMQESFSDLIIAFLLAVVLVYAIMASQFESLIAPFVIMFCVPFGAVGALALTLVTGHTFSIVSACGIVVLVGIVINNGIVLVDYMNQLIRGGMTPEEAAAQSGYRRFRPVMMTSLTTILGLLPMALGMGEGAELYAPLSISILGGLSISTLFTLIVVPVTYAGIRNRFPLKQYED